MNTILIISDQQADFSLFSANFAHLPVHFSWARSMDEALEKSNFEQPFILFTVSRELEPLLNWINIFNNSGLQVPLVSFSAALDWADREMLWKSGVSDLVELPRSRKELEYIIRAFMVQTRGASDAVEQHMRGRLQDLGLIDLTRSFGSGKKNGVLNLEQGTSGGFLEFNRGKLVNAGFSDCDPLESVMVMSLWKEGAFYGTFSSEKYKEKILLDNEQIIDECLSYQNKYHEYRKKLPEWGRLLFTDPDLEYQEFGPRDREILQQFRRGLSLDKFMSGYSGNWNFILKKFILWLDRKWILREETYRLLQAKIRADERKSGFRKVFDKVFSRDQKAEFLATQDRPNLISDTADTEVVNLPCLFNQAQALASFKDTNKGVVEIPVLVADDQEDSIFFDDRQHMEEMDGSTKIFQDEIWLAEEKSIIYYRVIGFAEDPVWSEYDALLTKVPFVLVLFHHENVQVQRLIQNLTSRYQTPFYFISSRPVNPGGTIKKNKNLAQILEEHLILFDSVNDDRRRQVFDDALKMHLTAPVVESPLMPAAKDKVEETE